MPEKNIIERLIANVMSERQAKVYFALLQNGEGGPSELQRASGIPLSKISETVNYLLSNGYIRARKVGRKRFYEVIDPEVTMKSNIAKLDSKISTLTELTKDLAEVYQQRGQAKEPFEYIEIIHGNDNIHHKYLSLLKSTKEELLSFTRPPFSTYTTEMDQAQTDVFYAFRERGGKSRWIKELSSNPDPLDLKLCEIAAGKGEQFLISDKLPLKMMIFDKEILLLADEGKLAEGELSMSIIKQETMVNGYVALFDFFWSQSITFEEWKKKHPLPEGE